MGASTANISRRIYDERKRYVQTVLQQGVPLVDADYNDSQESFYAQIRRVVQTALGEGASGVAFKVVERRDGGPLVPNDFLVQGGHDPRKGPERLWVAGHGAAAYEDLVWSSAPEITPRSTGLTHCELFDSAAFFVPGELVGRTLIPNVANPAKTYVIQANTANSITVDQADQMIADGASPGDPYRIALTTPAGAPRTDIVYIDCYLDEIDATEDPNLLHTFSVQLEAMRRLVLVQAVLVAEGGVPPAPPSPDDPLVDADGNQHFILPIARINREADNPNIEDHMIEDLRRKIFSLDEIDDRYVNVDGDTMTGDLIFSPGVEIQGTDVLGADEIKDESVGQTKLDRVTHLLGDGSVVPQAGELPIVHDNRYYPKSVLSTFFGPNRVVNGEFEKGVTGWIHNLPFPIQGAPAAEILEKVRVGWRLCSPGACNGLFVHFYPGYKGCEVSAVAQELEVCGGGLLAWSQTVQITRGTANLRPSLTLSLYASNQFLGQVRIPFYETVDQGGGVTARAPVVMSPQHGLRRLRALLDLGSSVETVIVALTLELDVEGCGLDELHEVIIGDVRGWRFADDGSILNGLFTPAEPPQLDPPSPGDPTPLPDEPVVSIGGANAETAVALAKSANVTVLEGISDTGVVRFRPGYRQSAMNVFRSPDGVTSMGWDPSTDTSYEPELVEVVPTRVQESIKSSLGLAAGDPPPRILTIDTDLWEIGTQPHITIAGQDFDAALTVTIIGLFTQGASVGPFNVQVSGLGDQMEFDLDLTGVVAQTARLILENPDGKEDILFVRILETADVPVVTTLELAQTAYSIDEAQTHPFMVRVLDQFGVPMRGVAVDASSDATGVATVTPAQVVTDALGIAAFNLAGVAAGSATISFAVAGTGVQEDLDLTVLAAGTGTTIIDSVAADVAGVALQGSGTQQVTITVLDDGAAPIAALAVDAATVDAAIADVIPAQASTNGTGQALFTVRAQAPGVTTHLFKAGGLFAVVGASVDQPAPIVHSVAPAQLFPDTTQILEIQGTGFQSGAAVTTPLSEIAIGRARVFAGGTILHVEATLDPATPLGALNVTVTNVDARALTLAGAAHVSASLAAGPGDVGYPTLDDQVYGENANSLRVLIDPAVEPATVVQVMFGHAEAIAPGSKLFNLVTAGVTGNLRFELAAHLEMEIDLAVSLIDSAGLAATVGVGRLVAAPGGGSAPGGLPPIALPTDGSFVLVETGLSPAFQPQGFNWTEVTGVRFTLTPAPAAYGAQSTVWFDTIRHNKVLDVDGDGLPDMQDLELFDSFVDQPDLDPYTLNPGAQPVIQVPSAISRDTVPVIVAPAETMFDVKFYGDPGWDQADVVLVKGTEVNKAAGVIDAQEGIEFGFAHYAVAPYAGCRSVFVEPAYIATAPCRSVVARARSYEFYTGDCECSPETPEERTVADPVTDPLMTRLVPDDGFGGTPTDYGEMFWLEYCDPASEQWIEIGSKSTPNQVLHAGGGRNDPNIPPGLPMNPTTGDPIFVTVYHGPGSNQGARESLLALDVHVESTTTQVAVTISPGATGGFAIGMPVWLRNACMGTGCKYSHCEVEAAGPADPKVYGLYGEVVAVDSLTNQITVRFFEAPQVGAGGVDFLTELSAALIVSPRGAMGFYLEASPGLAELLSGADGTCIRWWFRYWEAAASDCVLHDRYDGAGVLLADGDGETRDFPFSGEADNLFDPAEWRRLWSKPIAACDLKTDLLPGATQAEVCTPSRFRIGDIVRFVDDQAVVGWRTTVTQVSNANSTLDLADPVPATLPGLPGFSGFKVSRDAMAFKPVVRANHTKSPTTRVAPDGTPLFGSDFVAVDFDAGRFTFDRSFAGHLVIYYGAEKRTYQLPPVTGLYKLQAINHAGLPGWNSGLIRVGPIVNLTNAGGN